MSEFVMNQNNDLRNNNYAMRQEAMDELAMINATYNEHNRQPNQQASLENAPANIPTMESPLMSNEALLEMEASLEDPNADISMFGEFMEQNDDRMDNNAAIEQEFDDLISNIGNEQARFDEVGSIQQENIVYPTMILNNQHVAAIIQNAGIQIGDEEYLVELHAGVSSIYSGITY